MYYHCVILRILFKSFSLFSSELITTLNVNKIYCALYEKSSWRSQWERRDQFDLWSEWIISIGIYNHILNIQTPCVLFGPTLLIKCCYPGTRSNLLSLYTGPCVRPAWYGGLLFQVPSIVNGPKLFAPRWILKYAPCIRYEWMKPF